MRRIEWLTLGLAVATAVAAAPPAIDARAYRTLGRMAVQQQGRRKPFDTLAREAVKQIHGDSSVKQLGPEGTVVATWPAVAAVLDWSIRRGFWDAQDIILIPHLPLKRALLDEAARERLRAVASRRDTPAGARDTLNTLAGGREISAHDLNRGASLPGLDEGDRLSLIRLARKLSADRKWLSPRDVEEAVVTIDGKRQTFPDWFDAILTRYRAIHAEQLRDRLGDPASIAPLSALEEKAMEVGERLVRYRALRDRDGRAMEGLEIEVAPRPVNAAYLAFTREALLKAPRFVVETFPAENLDRASLDTLRESSSSREPDAFEVNVLEVFGRYIDEVKRKDRFLPGTNHEADARYQSWLEEKVDWVPLRFLLEPDLEELGRAGYPASEVERFRVAYRALEASERANPGHASEEEASAVVASARALGTAASKAYPDEATLALETHYNRAAPFAWAPWPYGIALALFLVCTGMMDGRHQSSPGMFGRGLYVAGMLAFIAGIAIECYGFTLRVLVSGWAPVTNMYETVIWVALVTPALGLVLELIYRKTFAALAASGIALLTTVLAAGVPERLLDPRIKSLTPVLRSNYWLTIHVLTIVSSYAAFALAMGLGLVGVGYYLTATYRRPARFGELATPLVPGVLLLVPGAIGVYLSYAQAGAGWLSSTPAFFVVSGVAELGGVMIIMSATAMLGEAANRDPIGTTMAGLTVLAVGLVGLVASFPGPGPGVLSVGSVVLGGLGAVAALLGLFGMSGRVPVVDHRAAGHERAPSPAVRVEGEGMDEGASVGVALRTKRTADVIRPRVAPNRPRLDGRSLAMQATAARISPISRFLDRAMQVGVLLVAAGTILGGVWADYSWGRFWGWDPKEVWALITLLVYLVPLHGRFAGWVDTFGLVVSSVVCFGSVLMAWYGVNFVLGVGLHSYGFGEGGGQGLVLSATLAVIAIVLAAAWRRRISQCGHEMPLDV
jgi:ABC-type transport system involved in cytochrome c biogenesis permease subunit